MKITVEFASLDEFMKYVWNKDLPVKNDDRPFMDIKDLTVTTRRALEMAGIKSLKEAQDLGEHKLLRMNGIGRKSIQEIMSFRATP